MKTVEVLQEAKTEYWGYHLILDCAGCNDKIADKDQIKVFLKTLVKDIKMTAVGEPVIKYLLEGEPNAGFSVMQLIETSSITCHFVEPNSTMYIDVFSCKEFKPKDAMAVIDRYFAPKKVKQRFLKRQA
jgi:S-adenosylmethionine/arginine decarboxylase-like enzyme